MNKKECLGSCSELDILNLNKKTGFDQDITIRELWKYGTSILLKVQCMECYIIKEFHYDLFSFGDNEHLVEVYNEN